MTDAINRGTRREGASNGAQPCGTRARATKCECDEAVARAHDLLSLPGIRRNIYGANLG